MARSCSKSQKNTLEKNLIENEIISKKCKYKLEYPLMPENLCLGNVKADGRNFRSNNLNYDQNLMTKGKLKFQCHYEDRKRRIEVRRKKILQKLKKIYQIDAEGLAESTTREIIMKAEQIEREKREREKRNIEKTVNMITRLLAEQKYKNRGRKLPYAVWRKPVKIISKAICQEKDSNEENVETEHTSEMEEANEICDEKAARSIETLVKKNDSLKSALKPEHSKETVQEEEEEEKEDNEQCVKFNILDSYSQERFTLKPKDPLCVSLETCLKSSPECVVFQDYKKNRVYLQDLKITNVGFETIHCRYLGIVVHTKCEERFPIGVAVRDNVKLRPGLSCSTKIRLYSQDDTKELRCSVVYETRRKSRPLQHSWFFIQVFCVPIRAIVRVIPSKITFPSLTWCEATGPEGAKLLKKFIKIENSGGKACSCRISTTKLETSNSGEKVETAREEFGETEEERISVKTKSDLISENSNTDRKFMYSEEMYGELYSVRSEDSVEVSGSLVNELIENVFATFRFSQKFHVELPPFSTTHIEVRFIPHYKGFHQEMHFIQFEDCENCSEHAIEITGDIKKIPLKAEPQVIDLKTCVSNSGVYAGTFKIYNETKGPYSVFVKVPSSVKKHAHVHPRATTILARDCSEFSVRFYPRISLARDAPQYYNDDTRVLEFPIYIHPANVGVCKRDYIKIYVFALITNYCLQLTPPSINFGCVTTLETVKTEIKLTNHSLTIQEYGFINLPKGVRVEPNMGFGRILPRESIPLYVLYSPGEDLIGYDRAQQNHEFQIAVTSIAKYGGFREKPEPDEASSELYECFWGEDNARELSASKELSVSDDQNVQAYDSDDYDQCEDDSSIDGEELNFKIYQEENKIRQFLKEDRDKISEHSFFKRMSSQAEEYHQQQIGDTDGVKGDLLEHDEMEESESSIGLCELNTNLHVVYCQAYIVQPRFRISESVIQLPATPCSSFSLYRFRLRAVDDTTSCSCGFRKVTKKHGDNSKYQGSFEFQYFCPHIKLEPESGFIKTGDDKPITVIYRPEFPAEQLKQESRVRKAHKVSLEKKNESEAIVSRQKPDSKGPKRKRSTSKQEYSEFSYENAIEDIINVSIFELENYDLFAGERSLQELISPFYVETKLQCIIKTNGRDDQRETTEIHEMVLICPAIKPNFIYLGNSQEIKFNKVFIGTTSKFLVQIQNISFERISPSATLLNPVGPFYFPAGVKKVEIDVEHIWQQPLTYSPLEEKGIEKQFFEIFCGSTSIFLTVSGEGIQPEYRILPVFSSCLMEAKPGFLEELKLDIENLSSVKFNISLKVEFVKEITDSHKDVILEEDMKIKNEKTSEKGETKDKKKPKTTGSEKSIRFWDETPEMISLALKNLVEIQDKNLISKMFALAGVNDDNETIIPPFGRQQIKVQFTPPPEISDKIYAVKYAFMLERVCILKEIIVLGRIKQKN